MTEYLGFSWLGALFLLALTVPNLLWTRRKPQGYAPSREDRRLTLLERIGQVWVTSGALLSRGIALRPWSVWSWWLAGAAALMGLYEIWWARYFRSPRTMADFTAGLLGVPVAGASLPVAAFFLLGIYGRVWWMLPGVVVLGIGHIGIHLGYRREAAALSIYISSAVPWAWERPPSAGSSRSGWTGASSWTGTGAGTRIPSR